MMSMDLESPEVLLNLASIIFSKYISRADGILSNSVVAAEKETSSEQQRAQAIDEDLNLDKIKDRIDSLYKDQLLMIDQLKKNYCGTKEIEQQPKLDHGLILRLQEQLNDLLAVKSILLECDPLAIDVTNLKNDLLQAFSEYEAFQCPAIEVETTKIDLDHELENEKISMFQQEASNLHSLLQGKDVLIESLMVKLDSIRARIQPLYFACNGYKSRIPGDMQIETHNLLACFHDLLSEILHLMEHRPNNEMETIKDHVDRNCALLSTLSAKFKTRIVQLLQEVQECKFALAMAKRDHETSLNQLMVENEEILRTLNEAHAAKITLISGQFEEKLKNLENRNVGLLAILERQQQDNLHEMEAKEKLHKQDLEIHVFQIREMQHELAEMNRNEQVYLKDLETNALKIRQLGQELDKSRSELNREIKLREGLEASLVQKDSEIEQLKVDLGNQKRLLENLQLELSNFKDKENLMERNGNDVSFASSPASKRSRVGSLQEESCPRTGPVRVVFTGYRDPSGPKSLKYLGSLVEALGGHVHIGDVFSENVQHFGCFELILCRLRM